MFTQSRLVCSILLGSILLTGAASLEASVIQGEVKGPDGKPIPGAEVQVARVNSKQVLQRVTTDSKGRYTFNGLPSGVSFRVIAWVNKVPNAIDNVRARDEGAVRIDFEIKATAAKNVPSKKAKHMVWMPAPTGSNLGGKWVEVDDSAQTNPKADNMDRVSGESLRHMNRAVGAGGR